MYSLNPYFLYFKKINIFEIIKINKILHIFCKIIEYLIISRTVNNYYNR